MPPGTVSTSTRMSGWSAFQMSATFCRPGHQVQYVSTTFSPGALGAVSARGGAAPPGAPQAAAGGRTARAARPARSTERRGGAPAAGPVGSMGGASLCGRGAGAGHLQGDVRGDGAAGGADREPVAARRDGPAAGRGVPYGEGAGADLDPHLGLLSGGQVHGGEAGQGAVRPV